MFVLVHTGSFGVATQALLLLYQLLSSQATISDRFYRALYAALLAPDLPKSTKAPLFLSLFLKATRNDVSKKRTASLLKRLLQTALCSPTNFTCGALVIVSELLKEVPGLWHLLLDAEEGEYGQDEEDLIYDPNKRDPLYSNADHSCVWEICLLAQHQHPSVSAMAKTLLAGVPVQYSGNPLKEFTFSEFLEKFVSKKPKARVGGDSFMQPLKEPSTGKMPLDKYSSAEVAPGDAFFHTFYSLKKQDIGKRKRTKEVDEDSSDAEDEFLLAEEDVDRDLADDIDGEYDYATLASAMDDGDGVIDNASDDSISESLEGDEFPDELLDEAEMDDRTDDEEVFADADKYNTMIDKDYNENLTV